MGRKSNLLVLSAKTESALETATDNLVEHFRKHPELDLVDVAYTLQVGRKEFNYRRMVVGKDIEDVAIALQSKEPQKVLTHHTLKNNHSIVFMFPGQGSQYANMGKELYETEPVFREWIDRCSRLLEPELGLDLRSLIYPVGAIRESPLQLHTSHAFHSPMMDKAIAPLTQAVAKVKLNPPQIPFISNVTGTWITAEEAINPHYWAKHARETVRFAAGISELLQDKDRILLEVGAGRTLSTFVKRNTAQSAGQIVLSSLPHPKETVSDIAFILNMLGRLWLAGVEIDWCNFSADKQRRRVPLPTYPFERQHYWIDPVVSPTTPRVSARKMKL